MLAACFCPRFSAGGSWLSATEVIKCMWKVCSISSLLLFALLERGGSSVSVLSPYLRELASNSQRQAVFLTLVIII